LETKGLWLSYAVSGRRATLRATIQPRCRVVAAPSIDGQIELLRQSGRREIHPVDVGADRVTAGADVDG
jgi:hypothetical protein